MDAVDAVDAVALGDGEGAADRDDEEGGAHGLGHGRKGHGGSSRTRQLAPQWLIVSPSKTTLHSTGAAGPYRT